MAHDIDSVNLTNIYESIIQNFLWLFWKNIQAKESKNQMINYLRYVVNDTYELQNSSFFNAL